MDRFQHIIRFGLWGHTHDETFFLTRNVLPGDSWDTTQTKPILTNFIFGPSTTYTNKNPSMAVYDIDEETMLIVNVTTYFFNITEANLGNPEWKLFHNVLSDYGMADPSPASFEQFANAIKDSEEVALDF